MIVVGILIGLIVGLGSLFLYGRKYIREGYISIPTVKQKLTDIPKKRGLMRKEFTWRSVEKGDIKVNLDIEFEVIDEGSDLVKIKTKKIGIGNLNHSCDYSMQSYKKAFDDKWYEEGDKDITWLRESKMGKRRRVIKSILEKVKT